MKRISKILSLIIGLILAGTMFVGCMGFSRVPNLNMEQRTDFVVRSQGGSAVQYGNIVYFINGFNTLTYDPLYDGRFNAWGDAQRGAIYRAELRGQRASYNESGVLVADPNGREWMLPQEIGFPANGFENTVYEWIEFYSERTLRHGINVEDDDFDINNEDNWVDLVNVERIVPKAIGTVGGNTATGHGGIFIFGEWIYYATPSITRDTAGRMQDNRVDFMRTRIDGSQTQLIYSTTGPANQSPYAFYRIGNAVYMVVFYTPADETSGRIVSVRMEDGRRRPNNPYMIADGVTGVIFPRVEFYDSVNHYHYQNTLEHFIFFTREFVHGDGVQDGNIVEMMRPSGQERTRIRGAGHQLTLVDVRDGLLIYTESNVLDTQILKYDNLHNALMGVRVYGEDNAFLYWYGGSETYREHQLNLDVRHDGMTLNQKARARNIQINSTLQNQINVANFAPGFIFFRDDLHLDPMILATSAHGPVQVVSALNIHNVINEVWPTAFQAKHQLVGNMLYFTNEGYLMRINILERNATPERMSHTTMEQNHFAPDLVAGFVMYFGFVDEWTVGGGMAFFRSTRRQGAESVLVYGRPDSEMRPEEEDDNSGWEEYNY
ncbi:MAG: hypothetical protein FWC11_03630 [Firmicutes bacterium]|nr:hypothetical protein [Bacillota bacterium]MCL2255931.1 hypothetical protein [Bacillota bacterium]